MKGGKETEREGQGEKCYLQSPLQGTAVRRTLEQSSTWARLPPTQTNAVKRVKRLITSTSTHTPSCLTANIHH